MQIINDEIGFGFSIPDAFSMVKREAFGTAFNMSAIQQKVTLYMFVKLNNEGKVLNTISVTQDKKCQDEKEYIEVVLKNINVLKTSGFNVKKHETISGGTLGRYDKLLVESANKILLSEYLTVVNGHVLCFSIGIEAENDINDQLLQTILKTIKRK